MAARGGAGGARRDPLPLRRRRPVDREGGTGGRGGGAPVRPGGRCCSSARPPRAPMALLFLLHRTEETAYRYGVLGHGYEVAGDADAAIACFEKSLEMDRATTG